MRQIVFLFLLFSGQFVDAMELKQYTGIILCQDLKSNEP